MMFIFNINFKTILFVFERKFKFSKNSGEAKRKKIDVVYSRSSNLRQGAFLSDVCVFGAAYKKLPIYSAVPFHNQQQHTFYEPHKMNFTFSME